MILNEERKQVATKLRNYDSLRELFRESPICAFFHVLGVENCLNWKGVCNRLADLIEPEEERTCTFSIAQGCINRPICSACGYEADAYDCDHWIENDASFWEYSRNFCDGCGAKVERSDDAD